MRLVTLAPLSLLAIACGGRKPCTVQQNTDQTSTLICPDGSSVVIPTETPDPDRASCNVIDHGDGSKTLTCPDGTSVTITDGKDGEPGLSGQDGTDGTSCTATDNGNGTQTISCPDGTSLTLSTEDHSLKKIQGSVSITDALTAALLGSVEEITGNLTITAPGLVAIELPALHTIGGDLAVSFQTDLASLDMPALTHIGSQLLIDHNDRLASLDGLHTLQTLGGNLYISDNGQLCQDDVEAWIAQLQAGGWEGNVGNKAANTGACPP